MTQPQPVTVDVPFYVQVEPRWSKSSSYWNDDQGNPHLDNAVAVALTQQKPKNPRRGVVVTKLTLRFPAGAFLPLSPEAVIEIPESLATVVPLHVIAQHPGEIVVDDDATDPVVPE